MVQHLNPSAKKETETVIHHAMTEFRTKTFVSKTWVINSGVFSKGTRVPCIRGCQENPRVWMLLLLQGSRRKINSLVEVNV
jgi:hypothetical protein